ncbi:MAG: 16S rRNA processing protein RimM [Anaerolineaceae bacterium]|nr:16S rRNA processing protein RimM [Anaerolineaceae bacterium]
MAITSGAERGNANQNNNEGSLQVSGPEFICIGKIHRTHGIKGDVILDPMTDFPERIRRGRSVYAGDEHRPLTIARARQKPPYLLVGFKEIEDETAAAEFRNKFLYVKTSDLPELPEGEYYYHQLIGLDAVDQNGQRVGTLSEVLETGANDVYVIKKDDGAEELVPDVPQFIQKINIPGHKIEIIFPEWI